MELVAAILDLVDPPTLAACARVCQSWKEPALDRLWRDMTSPVPLMEVLSPLHGSKVNGKTSWVRPHDVSEYRRHANLALL